jgi:hypothetical protein
MPLLEVLGLKGPAGGLGSDGDSPAKEKQGDAERADAAAFKRFEAFAKRVDAELDKAKLAVDAQPIPAIKAKLEAELQTLQQSRREADVLAPVESAKRVEQLDSPASNFRLKVEGMLKDAVSTKRDVDERCVKPLAAITAKVNALTGGWKEVFEPQLKRIQAGMVEVNAKLDNGEWDAIIKPLGAVFYACQNLDAAVEGYKTDYKPFVDQRKKVEAMLERMKSGGLLDASGTQDIKDLEALLSAADALGPIRGYKAALAQLNTIVVKAVAVRDANAAYADYAPARAKVNAKLVLVKAHPQAGKLTAEIKTIEDQLKAADKLSKRADGGSLKALTALKSITVQCDEALGLAGKLAANEKKLPALTKKLTDGGVPKGKIEQTARFALKLLVEENCSDDDAVKMAKDANGYADEGLAEQDAIMSSRVKKSLEDSGLPADHARAIGRNIRAGGTSSADDAKAVAQAMKIISRKAIDTLTKDGITTQCCRGPITDAAPDLAGVKPRGWPETATWDEVPGVYMGGEKKLIVGTMDDGGKREVPPKDKGPLPHGATDLFGHEAGHAFDAADGGGKKGNAAFLAARSADIATGNPGGMIPGTDDYFLTKAEKGANDAGATSETFAESFAMHFAGKSRWPKLEEFWSRNPWGI